MAMSALRGATQQIWRLRTSLSAKIQVLLKDNALEHQQLMTDLEEVQDKLKFELKEALER